jgi:hypothetical protein
LLSDKGDQLSTACAVFLKNERGLVRHDELRRRVGRLLELKTINNPVDNLQIKLLKGSGSVINFALPKKIQ